jgi:glycosyltransferase involved in cell wall biosynthesis
MNSTGAERGWSDPQSKIKIVSTFERLRVLHIIPSFGVAGAEQTASYLMVALSEWHDVAGVCLYPSMNSSIESRLLQANIPVWHLGKRTGFDPKLFKSLDRVLKEVRPHVVHTHLSVLRYALPGLRRRRVPVVVHTLHNLAEHETDAFGRVVQWFAFRRAVLPVAISREVAASVKRVYGVECKAMVPNCIPVENYRRSLADRVRWREKERFDRNAILFTCVGRLEPQKNPLLLVQAFAALNNPRIHLIMLGEGSLREQLAVYIREHGLERRVHLLGKRNEVPECLAASDVFVLSSNWEGNPLAVMEAMAAGLPVVATAVGGVPELVESGQQGILVPPGDCAAFTDAMRTLLNDPEKRMAMANAAHARATAAFNVERMAQGYESIYRAALTASGRANAAAA